MDSSRQLARTPARSAAFVVESHPARGGGHSAPRAAPAPRPLWAPPSSSAPPLTGRAFFYAPAPSHPPVPPRPRSSSPPLTEHPSFEAPPLAARLGPHDPPPRVPPRPSHTPAQLSWRRGRWGPAPFVSGLGRRARSPLSFDSRADFARAPSCLSVGGLAAARARPGTASPVSGGRTLPRPEGPGRRSPPPLHSPPPGGVRTRRPGHAPAKMAGAGAQLSGAAAAARPRS